MTRARTPHDCPNCRCEWETTESMGAVNRKAEFYPLVQLCDRAAFGELGPRSRPNVVNALREVG